MGHANINWEELTDKGGEEKEWKGTETEGEKWRELRGWLLM